MEFSKNYALNADYAAQSARDLAFLFNQIEESETVADEKSHIRRYNEILSQSRVRHAMIDYHGFQLANPGEFDHTKLHWLKVGSLYIIEIIVEYWMNALMVLGPLAPIWKVISLIVDGRA